MFSRDADPDLTVLIDRIVQAILELGWTTVVLVWRDESLKATYPVAAASTEPGERERLLDATPVPLWADPFREDRWREPHYRISRSYLVTQGPPVDRAAPECDPWLDDDRLIVPLELDGETVGWFSIEGPVDDCRPALVAVRRLEVFADQVAPTLQQAHLRRQMAEQAAYRQVLNEIAHTIGQYLSLGDLFAAVMWQLRKVFPVTRGSIVLREGERPGADLFVQDDRQAARHGPPAATPLETVAQTRILTEQEDFRIVAETLTGAHAEDAALAAEGVRSYVSLPLVVWGRTIGAFSLASENVGAFAPDHADFLIHITDQIAGAVWNALLYEREQHRRQSADALVALARSVNATLELDEVLELALDQLKHLVDYDSSSVMLLDDGALCITAARGFSNSKALIGAIFYPHTDNVALQVLRNQRTIVYGDVQREPNWGHERDDIEGTHTIRSWIGVPLIVRGESIGILTIDNYKPAFFTERDAEIASAVGEQIATAIQNARLYRSEQRKRQTAAALVELAQKVNATLKLDEVLELALRQVDKVVPYDTAAIMLVEGPNLVIAACRGFEAPEKLLGSVIQEDEVNLAFEVLRERRVEVVPDVRQDDRWGHIRDHIDAMREIRGWIGAPLIVQGEAVGVLTIDKHEPGFYGDEDGETAAGFATQIATAIQNARLYRSEQHKRRTAAALVHLAQTVNSTLQPDEVLALALQDLDELLVFDAAWIMLLEGSTLVMAASRGTDIPDEMAHHTVPLREAKLVHDVLWGKRVRVFEDVHQVPGWRGTDSPNATLHAIRSWIAAPLIVHGRPVGMLTIDKHEPGFYGDEDGETAAGFATQIATAIHNAQLYRATLEQRDRFSAILNDASDSVVVLDDALNVWLVNPAAERYLRVYREDILGQPVDTLNLPELRPALETARDKRQPVAAEFTGPEKTTLHASIAPVHGVGWVILMQDITPLKELDRLRTEWVAAVSHDLKNPIQIIQFSVEMLESEVTLNEAQHEYIRLIREGGERLRGLVTGVLDLARLEAGPTVRFMPVDTAAMLHSSLDEVRQLANEKSLRVVADLPRNLPQIQGDSALLQRAISNLLGNAIKYTPGEGTVTLRARHEGGWLKVAVSDTGKGIPEEALPHLFDRFYRVPGATGEGSGLGLSIVKSIVEKHQGTVEVRSQMGQGSTFELVLPLKNRAG